MKLVFIILLFLSLGCSNHMEEKKLSDINIFISSDHKILSNPELIKERFLNLLNGEELDFSLLTNELYKTTWIYAFQSKKRWPNRYDIKVKEHQPVAKWGEKNYLTHSGILITPSLNDSYVHLVVLKGKESEKFLLLDISRQIQNQLNRYNETIKEVNLSSGGLLLISTEKGTELVFTKKDFREQLERLEDLISFELLSGSLHDIKTIDMRYKNGVAIAFGNKEKV